MGLSRLHNDKKWAKYRTWVREQLLRCGSEIRSDSVLVRERIDGLKAILVEIEQQAALELADDQRQSDV